jgi:hypothetical protein
VTFPEPRRHDGRHDDTENDTMAVKRTGEPGQLATSADNEHYVK